MSSAMFDPEIFATKTMHKIDFNVLNRVIGDVKRKIARRYIASETQYYNLQNFKEKEAEMQQKLQKTSSSTQQIVGSMSLQLQLLKQQQENSILKVQNNKYEQVQQLDSQQKMQGIFCNDYLSHFIKFYIPLKVLLKVNPSNIIKRPLKPFTISQNATNSEVEAQVKNIKNILVYRKLASADTIWPDREIVLGNTYQFASAYDEQLFKDTGVSSRHVLDLASRVLQINGQERVLGFAGVQRYFYRFDESQKLNPAE